MAGGNVLYYGDNLDVLRQHVATDSVDLIYLDPPFNSNKSYNVLFKSKSGESAQAQIEAFDDTWTWSQQSEQQYLQLIQGGAPARVADALEAMRRLLGDNDVLAYLVMMTARLLQLHRVLKPSGALYLHCDPTASHYLKLLLDAVFGQRNFRSEVIWKRTHSHSGGNRFGPVHDILLFYAKSASHVCTPVRTAYSEDYLASKFRHYDDDGRRYRKTILTGSGLRSGSSGMPWRGVDPSASGRHWAVPGYLRPLFEEPAPATVQDALDRLDTLGRIVWPKKSGGNPELKQYVDDMQGAEVQDVWTDLPPINSRAAERLGYPTQKPVALLERIIEASSDPGDIVLDPFCGCGTSVDAAERLGRRWIGIDITYLAIDLIDTRLRNIHGEAVAETYRIDGIPEDVDGARALFAANPFDFERWAVSLVNGQPNQKQVGDKGVDGVIRFPLDNKDAVGRVLVSVKGGGQLNPSMVRDLVGTVEQQRVEMGVFICMGTPTSGMTEVANKSGTYAWPVNDQRFPKIQIITVQELLDGKRPAMPTPFLPYVQARRLVSDDQMSLDV